MTQIEREELVERYLSGEMNPSEEADFFLHAAVDDELQRTLKAFRIMEHAIQHDREMVVAERSRYREHIMGLLAVTTPIAGAGVGSTAASGSISGGAAAGSGASVAGSGGFLGAGLGLWKTIVLSVVAGSAMVGTTLFVLSDKNGDAVPATSPAAVSGPSEQRRGIDLTPPIDSATTQPAPMIEAEKTLPAEPATSSPKSGEARAQQKGTRSTEPREARSNRRAGATTSTSGAVEEPAATPRRQEPIKLDPQNNTGDLEVKIDPKKKQ